MYVKIVKWTKRIELTFDAIGVVNLSVTRTLVCCLILAFGASCSAPAPDRPDTEEGMPFDAITDTLARNVMQKAIAAAGGWDQWLAIDSIRYVKRSVLYHADGSVESDVTQQHAYQLRPALSGEITWTDRDTAWGIHYDSGEAYRTANDRTVAGSERAAREAFMSAYYVLFVPFKLLDPGTELIHEGVDTLASGAAVDVIRASYDPATHDNHSTQDTWWYFFERESGKHLGSMVYHAPTYALIENTETTDDFPIRFNTYRESFRCDSLRSKEYLRGVFYYNNYHLK